MFLRKNEALALAEGGSKSWDCPSHLKISAWFSDARSTQCSLTRLRLRVVFTWGAKYLLTNQACCSRLKPIFLYTIYNNAEICKQTVKHRQVCRVSQRAWAKEWTTLEKNDSTENKKLTNKTGFLQSSIYERFTLGSKNLVWILIFFP